MISIIAALTVFALAGIAAYVIVRNDDRATTDRAAARAAVAAVAPTPVYVGAPAAVSAVAAGDASLLDVRTDEEWSAGHAKGAEHFDLARLQAGELPDIAQDRTIYVYCKAGGRAEQAKEILTSHGFTHVVNIGGLSDWEAAGGPTE